MDYNKFLEEFFYREKDEELGIYGYSFVGQQLYFYWEKKMFY